MEQMSPENALAYYEQKCYLAGLLRRADRMSMVNKIELRVPFMDHRLVLALNNISAELKSGVTRSSEKRILKQIAKGKVPNAIINRKKYGFGSPLKLYEGFFANRLSIENRFKNNYISLEQLWLLNTIFFNTGEIKK
jgi:asparagine synthetase B (glutamine-hydrolysing)